MPRFNASAMENILGYRPEVTDVNEVLRRAKEKYHIFHLIAEEGSYMRGGNQATVVQKWRDLLGDRAVLMPDYKRMPEIIGSLIHITEGGTEAAATEGMDSDTSLIVRTIIRGIGAPGRRVDMT